MMRIGKAFVAKLAAKFWLIRFKPPGNPTPRIAQGRATHKETKVTARLAASLHACWRSAQEPRCCKRLVERYYHVICARQQKERDPHLGQVDFAAERNEASLRDPVFPKNPVRYLDPQTQYPQAV